jgi:hypothetical protein
MDDSKKVDFDARNDALKDVCVWVPGLGFVE